MSTPAASSTARSPATAGLDTLRRVVDSGLLRCAVPAALGGAGTLQDLAEGAAALDRRSPAAARVLRAQRLAIEALVRSPNIGLREHRLGDLLSGEHAGTLPASLSGPALQGTDTGRGWLLHGTLAGVANLQWIGWSVVTPVRLGDEPPVWVLLGSEDSGLRLEPDRSAPPDSRTAALHVDRVHWREDEWLAGPDLPQQLQAVADALSGGLRHDARRGRTTASP